MKLGRMATVRATYNVPAKRGRKVRSWYKNDGHWSLALEGRITSSCGGYLWINGIGPFHPTYGLEYLNDDGTCLLDTRDSHPSFRIQHKEEK